MMPVVVHHYGSSRRGFDFAKHLQPPVNAAKVFQRTLDRRVINLEFRGYGNRCQGI